MKKPPKGWKVKTLAEILTGTQIDRVTRIVNHGYDQTELINKLKEYFASIQDDLDKKEVDPCYLAYYLAHATEQKRRDILSNN